ncbi:MAG: cysteine desulfurase [Chloroflexota bacterium]|nr:cysteine desulfurase [Chloroflexota bacterium]
MTETIYLDHAATTPLDPDVGRAMFPHAFQTWGNPSSIYQAGQDARAVLDDARTTVAAILGASPSEVVFTGGATESDNLALSGVAWAARLAAPTVPGPHIVTSAIEHSAVLETAEWLQRIGFEVTYVPCDAEGLVDPETVRSALRPETCLISVMYANNEVGAIQPVDELGRVARAAGIPFHVDATQAPGLLPLDVDGLGVDLLTLSAHKFYGPKGVGLLYVRTGTRIAWQQHGGGQEGGRRGGTEDVAGIVGLAAALDRAETYRPKYDRHCRDLRDRLQAGLAAAIDDIQVNGPAAAERRLPNILNVTFRGVQGETLLLNLDMQGIAASAGSACTAGNSDPSHVLLAMGIPNEAARSTLRFSVGHSNTPEQIDEVVDIVAEPVARIRSLARTR